MDWTRFSPAGMPSRHPSPTSSVAVPFGIKTGGSHSSARSSTASCFMPDIHVSGRESAGTYLSHSTWTAIALRSASFTNPDHTPWDGDDAHETNRRFIEMVPGLVDLGAKALTFVGLVSARGSCGTVQTGSPDSSRTRHEQAKT